MQSHKILSSLEERIFVTCTKHTENRGQFQNSLREKNSDYTILPFTHNRQFIPQRVDSDSRKKCFTFWISTVLNLLTLPEHTLKNNKTMLNFLVIFRGGEIKHCSEFNLATSFIYVLEMNIHSALPLGHKLPT